MSDTDAIAFENRNALVQCLLNPAWRARIPDGDKYVRQAVAQFRAAMAAHVSDSSWKSVVERLNAESPLFTSVVSRVRPRSRR
ncbi:hypothetical protein ABZU76_08025 [Amycolatopsis sp. NPDC005232]|uniref:MmyB family transcriptional regulator n=1 Tax=Amycolatopsis sp. NPDC005232 TaxID=3157027 RepID=UPI0033A615D3